MLQLGPAGNRHWLRQFALHANQSGRAPPIHQL